MPEMKGLEQFVASGAVLNASRATGVEMIRQNIADQGTIFETLKILSIQLIESKAAGGMKNDNLEQKL